MIGPRVRLAREACRLTQQELAASAGIAQGTLSDIEAGRVAQPSDDTVKGIARATQFPVSFFFQGPLPDLPDGNYRRQAKGSSKVARQVRAQVRQVAEIIEHAEVDLHLPPIGVNPIGELTGEDSIEDVARESRLALGLEPEGPVPNVTRAVERAGVVVFRLPGEMERHDSYATWPDFRLGGRPLIALMGRHPGDRDRFNVSHELGHLVLHTIRHQLEPRQAEREAHRFAGALLLPRASAMAALRPPVTLRVLMQVKATYGVSIAAAAQRALDLQLVSRPQFVSIRKQISKRGWRFNEPVEVDAEQPLLMPRILEHLAGEGPIQARAERLNMSVFTYRALIAA